MDGQEILITSMCPRGREDRGKEREKENERMKMRDVEQRSRGSDEVNIDKRERDNGIEIKEKQIMQFFSIILNI